MSIFNKTEVSAEGFDKIHLHFDKDVDYFIILQFQLAIYSSLNFAPRVSRREVP